MPDTGVVWTNTTTTATLAGTVVWNGRPVIDDDEGGTAGVREPRRPVPPPLAPAALALELAVA
jgi:hypothetical protein